MYRREFIASGSAIGLGVAQASLPQTALASAPSEPGRMKLGCQSLPSDEEHFKYFARFGVEACCAMPQIMDKEIGYSYMIMPDHVPQVASDTRGLQSLAFCYGDIRALIQAVNSMA